MSVFVTDTHPLLWYASGDTRRMSGPAKKAFDDAWERKGLIWIPAAVMWEVSLLIRVGKVQLRETFPVWARNLLYKPGFGLAELNVDAVIESSAYPNPDPFDGIIVGTARALKLPLITRDVLITDSGAVEVHW